MKARWLYLAVPMGLATVVALAYVAIGSDHVTTAMLTVENGVVFAAAITGSVLAALAFGKGDYLRSAWALMALCYVLLLVDTLLFGAANQSLHREVSTTEALVSGALTVLANLVTVISLVWVARAWRIAGLDLQVSRVAFITAVVLALAVSGAIVSTSVVSDVRDLAAGKLDALQGLASAVGDIAATVLLVPMLLTALSLRGGSLAWPWGLLTASTVLWLGIDAIEPISSLAGVKPEAMVPFEEACRVGACLFQFTAGLAQREAVKVL